ncbi:T6SS effector BTH_I2691 family protein [Collimonas pratensis]|uniref:Putative transmembrane protein n=1 Tax=Collimonas pratensis TaxID=279113 RepID=A0A127QC70_9BURK|nr:T6SS effector BTH_I2691 family protein [Collimonas pratensis]AMP07658.1 putative transmembrane protein [Collimonas pratensis]
MPKCEFCDRKGLLIYPVRYAIACPAGAAGVPGLSGNFKIDAAPQDIGTAKYTLRAMRAGYLYTYDEKRGLLKAYMVMPKGHMWNFPVEQRPPRPEMVPFQCVDTGEVVRAHCVDIAHTPADPATNLWIGWTSVIWTKALIKKVSDAAWRKKHMQCINVPAMLAGGAQHTAEFKANASKIAHFAADGAAMRKAFAFSNTNTFSENAQHLWASRIADIMAAQAPHNKGFIIAVNDPVGVTNDLSELVMPNVDSGFDEKMYHAKMVADLLEGTEKRVRAQAREDVVFTDDVAKNSEGNPDGDVYGATKDIWGMIKAGGPTAYYNKKEQDKKKYGADQAGRQNAAEDNAWEEMTHEDGKPTLDENRLKSFPAEYDAAVKAFQPTFDKLVNAHVNWLKSEQLANWMDGVHDTTDIRSGYAYSESIAQCVGKAVCSKPCTDQLTAWLNSGKLSDTRNLYGRALLFNQNDIIAGTEPHLKGSDIQFENILNIYKGAIDRVDKREAAKLIDRLALTTANIIIKAISESSFTVMRGLAMAHLTLLGGVSVKASNMSASDLAKWAIAQAKAQGIKLDTNRTQTRADAHSEASNNVKKLPADRKLIAYELDIAKLEQEGRIAPGSIKGIKVPGIDATQKWLGSSAPQEFHLGVVTAIVQLVALGFATQDLANNDKFNERETRTKAVIAIVSLGATIVDTVGSTVEKSTTHPLAVFIRKQWSIDVEDAAKFAKNARIIGAVAGVVAGLYDLCFNAREAYGDKNYTLMGLYIANGTLGIGIAIAAYFAIGAIFWPLLIISFIVGIVIALVGSGLLKSWISRCHFGKSEHYDTFDAELKAYNHAVGA